MICTVFVFLDLSMLIKNQLGRFYFLYFILLLHVYTAFLTVINALSDREGDFIGRKKRFSSF